MNFLVKTISVAAAAALLGSAAGTAGAVAAGRSGGQTPQCAAASFFCITPVLYSPDLNQALGMTATARQVNSPVFASGLDLTDPYQDWMLEPIGVGRYPGGPRHPAAGLPGSAGRYRAPVPQLAYLEFSPAGIRSDLCAANVDDMLELRNCNGSKWQTFIITQSASGLTPPDFWSYFLSDVQAAAVGQHLAMTAAGLPGSQITFAVPWYSADQWWSPSDLCVTGRRQPAAGLGPRVC